MEYDMFKAGISLEGFFLTTTISLLEVEFFVSASVNK